MGMIGKIHAVETLADRPFNPPLNGKQADAKLPGDRT
jgi:hypothetical protein